jgi:hypothetical protein
MMGVPLTPNGFRVITPGRHVVAAGSAPNRRAGMIATGSRRVEDIFTWFRAEGGAKQGKRRLTLLVLCDSLRAAGGTPESVIPTLERAASLCDPPYPTPNTNDVPLAAIVRQSFTRPKISRHKNERLCRLLGITPEKAGALPLLSIKPKVEGEDNTPRYSRKSACIHRREFLATYMEQHPNASISEMRRAAVANHHDCTRKTVTKDIRDMGINQTEASLSLFDVDAT